ncbi:hypothetical protein LTR17_008550 [Elasticomyces elasticus]|nr:hypothetical protein LTR17_008550 [Elasticomyces elasticus]
MASLCATCNNIFEIGPRLDGWKDDSDVDSDSEHGVPFGKSKAHHVNVDDLFSAAAKGCFICNRLAQRKRESWDLFKPTRFDESLVEYRRAQHSDNSRVFTVGCSCSDVEEGETRGNHLVFSLERIEPSAARELSEWLPDSSTSSEMSWDRVASWLKICDNEHALCSSGRAAWHPTRLLEIVPTPSLSDLHTVRVRKLPAASEVSYVALSHCWGGIDTISLRVGNEAVLEAGIKCNELPKTFRDAILVTLRMKMNHIWIDSLCILQDVAEDWRTEAMQMHRVYRNAAVTLAATAAHNSTDGLFFDRHPDWVRPCVVDVRWTAAKSETFVVHDNAMWQDGIDNAPLNRRAWVLQERRLSRRIIHFARQQIFWECRALVASETFPEGPLRPLRTTRDVYELPAKVLDQRSGQPATHPPEAARAWESALKSYTEAGLTRETDRLIAISGLAKTFAVNSGDRYLAGMWEHDLIFQLPWRTRTPVKAKDSTIPYIAPSWSWASANAPVSWSSYNWMPMSYPATAMAKVIEVKLESASVDPFGQLEGGYLKLKALALNVRIYYGHSHKVYFDNYPPMLSTNLSFLLLYSYRTRFEPYSYAGILLQTSDTSPGYYRRVGTLTVERKDFSADVQDLIRNRETNLQEITLV